PPPAPSRPWPGSAGPTPSDLFPRTAISIRTNLAHGTHGIHGSQGYDCHSEPSEESTWTQLADSHWILRCAQNDKHSFRDFRVFRGHSWLGLIRHFPPPLSHPPRRRSRA